MAGLSWIPEKFRKSLAITYDQVLSSILVVSIVMLALVQAGCTGTAPALRKLYLLSATYHPSSQTAGVSTNTSSSALASGVVDLTRNVSLVVRGSFFGICVHQSQMLQSNTDWQCGTLREMATLYNGQYASSDPLGLVGYMSRFCSEVVFYGLFIASMISCLAVIGCFTMFPGWQTVTDDDGGEGQIKPFPDQSLTLCAMFGAGIAVAFSFVSTIWVHVGAVSAAGTLDFVFEGVVATNIGWLPLFLSWFAVGLQGVVLLGVVVMIQSIRLLERLTEED